MGDGEGKGKGKAKEVQGGYSDESEKENKECVTLTYAYMHCSHPHTCQRISRKRQKSISEDTIDPVLRNRPTQLTPHHPIAVKSKNGQTTVQTPGHSIRPPSLSTGAHGMSSETLGDLEDIQPRTGDVVEREEQHFED